MKTFGWVRALRQDAPKGYGMVVVHSKCVSAPTLDDTAITVNAPAGTFDAWPGGGAFDEDTNGGRVVVKLKRSSLGAGGKLFTRLRVVQAGAVGQGGLSPSVRICGRRSPLGFCWSWCVS